MLVIKARLMHCLYFEGRHKDRKDLVSGKGNACFFAVNNEITSEPKPAGDDNRMQEGAAAISQEPSCR